MEYLNNELVTFEKCVANELGPDIGNSTKTSLFRSKNLISLI